MKRLAVFLLFLVASMQACAQAQSGYEAAMLTYAAATNSYDTTKMSELMHPEEVRRFREVVLSALNGPRKDLATSELLPLFSVSSTAEFSKLTEFEIYKRMNDTVKRSAPDLMAMMKSAKYEIVGSFVKDDIAFVTYNVTMSVKDQQIEQQVVQKLKLHNDQWLLMLPSSADASLAGMKARYID